MHSTGNAAVAGRCKTPDSTVCGPIQLSPAAQRDRLRDAEGHARRASAGDSSRAGSEVGRGEGTAEESPPAGGVMDETDCSRLAVSNRPIFQITSVKGIGEEQYSLPVG